MGSITVDPTAVIGSINPAIFGGFVEHMHRCIYGGIYDPGSALSDAQGFRMDVLEAVRGLAPTHLRYPGGNFVSGYRWRDGVGPRETRPIRHEHAWGGIETNQFGTHEFIDYCRHVGSVPHLCVNLGDGTPTEAAEWVEYCNGTQDTTLTRLRADNGAAAPFAIPTWGLGNEMYGEWQVGYKNATEYARVAREAAVRMHSVDPTISLIACGFENSHAWNATILEALAQHVDYLSLHLYIGNDDFATALAEPLMVERLSREHGALAAMITRELGLTKRIQLAFDEWNVWFVTQSSEDIYSLKDALAVAGCLNSFVRCADIVAMANLSLLVNVSAPIFTGPYGLVRQTIYWPLYLYRRLAGHTALRTSVSCPGYRAQFTFRGWAIDEEVPYLDVSAALAPDKHRLTLAVVNRHHDAPIDVELRLVGMRAGGSCAVEQVGGPDFAAEDRNTLEEPSRVGVTRMSWDIDSLRPRCTFAPRSLTMLTIPVE
jgi:alpha-N-arabinofuranosidase